MDDEITIEYADSSRLVGDSLLDFFDSDESNAHLELMRLRGQAYSSLYGYAGTAINPYSHISLFNFDLGNSLSQQHLDKMDEFHQGLIAWQKDLLPKLKLIRSWDGSLMNLNRVNASLYLIYHQVCSLCSASVFVSMLTCTRPFWCFLDQRWSIFTMTGSMHEAKILPPSLTSFPNPKQCCKPSILLLWSPPANPLGFWNGCNIKVFFVSEPENSFASGEPC